VPDINDLEARVNRLRELSKGLARERGVMRAGEDPLLYLERRAYVEALGDATAGLETAAVILSRAVHRLRRVRAG
jgi:hypothetical protein